MPETSAEHQMFSEHFTGTLYVRVSLNILQDLNKYLTFAFKSENCHFGDSENSLINVRNKLQ